MKKIISKSNAGVYIALTIIILWCASLGFFLSNPLPSNLFLLLLFVLIQTHLYTGLFITAHDAMHGTVSSNKIINNGIGKLVTFMYALFSYTKLFQKHHQHHKEVHTENDPDYYEGNFFIWYFYFIKRYLTIWQVLAMAIIFNILAIWIPEKNLILFWVLPSLLSTLQLFYFGTYLPHRGEHTNIHQSKTQNKNHFIAFITCYFFGYHFEHHDKPWTPWWKLYQLK